MKKILTTFIFMKVLPPFFRKQKELEAAKAAQAAETMLSPGGGPGGRGRGMF